MPDDSVDDSPYPPCSNDTGGENDTRVAMALGYALGLMRNSKMAREMGQSIARVHDHQGDLFVLCRATLPSAVCGAFRLAWEDVGRAPSNAVHFPMVGSQQWDDVWGSRRFASDWTA